MPILFAHTHITQVYYWVCRIRLQIRLYRCLFFFKHIFLCIFAQYYANLLIAIVLSDLKVCLDNLICNLQYFKLRQLKDTGLILGYKNLMIQPISSAWQMQLWVMKLNIWAIWLSFGIATREATWWWSLQQFITVFKKKSTVYTYLRFVTELFIFERFPNTLAIKVYVNEHVWEA